MRLRIFLFVAFVFATSLSEVRAVLDQDTKFTARLLGVSDTKKTLLVNRGSEHGLALKQHAKISLPNGVVARAVVVRIAPSRSVWSVYRFYARDSITAKTVYTFKISSPIKLTTDESKAIGSLADKIDKKSEPIPQDPEAQRKQKKIKRSIMDSTKIVSQYDNVDYSKLNDSGLTEKKREEDIDWSALNGKKDADHFDDTLDYTRLR